MARTFVLTDTDDTVNLLDPTALIAERGGFGEQEVPLGVKAGLQVVERWSFNLIGTSHDNVAQQLQKLAKLASRAEEHQREIWRKKPVYLQQQTTGETAGRYARVDQILELRMPDRFDQPFESSSELEGMGMTIVRERLWRSGAPGSLGTALTLGASSGPATPLLVHVANFRDDGDLTHVFHYDDSLTTFSSNLLSAANGTGLFPSSPADEDILYFLSTDIPFKHACLAIATAMAGFTGTLVAEYWNGSAWTTAVLGTDFTVFGQSTGEITSLAQLFTSTGLWSINVFPPSAWAKTTVNGQNAYGFRIRIDTFTAMTTVPTKNGDTIYAQRSPYVEVPAAAIKGEVAPTFCIRMRAPSGGNENPGPASLSLILAGIKSNPATGFSPFLNAGGDDNPSGWTAAAGTDASLAAETAAPGGKHCLVTFATDSTMISRLQLTGDDKLADYEGEYLAMLRVQQIGGAAGDIRVTLRCLIGGSEESRPHIDLVAQKSQGADQGPEVLALGLLQLPFSRVMAADSLASTDVVFQVHAERTTGSGQLEILDLILMPTAESGGVGMEEPHSDTVSGGSALRGGNVLDLDGGVIADRTLKYIASGANLIPAEEWARMNRPPLFQNIGVKTRIYFLMLHFPAGGTWTEGPLVASLGCHLAVEIFAHYRYHVLRGAD